MMPKLCSLLHYLNNDLYFIKINLVLLFRVQRKSYLQLGIQAS